MHSHFSRDELLTHFHWIFEGTSPQDGCIRSLFTQLLFDLGPQSINFNVPPHCCSRFRQEIIRDDVSRDWICPSAFSLGCGEALTSQGGFHSHIGSNEDQLRSEAQGW